MVRLRRIDNHETVGIDALTHSSETRYLDGTPVDTSYVLTGRCMSRQRFKGLPWRYSIGCAADPRFMGVEVGTTLHGDFDPTEKRRWRSHAHWGLHGGVHNGSPLRMFAGVISRSRTLRHAK